MQYEVEDAPTYKALSARLVEDEELTGILDALPTEQMQPQLFFAAVNHLGGIHADYDIFRSFVLDRLDRVLEIVRTRRTQTNEIGRCATLLPALGSLPQPLALIEVGASAGLNLLLDRYAYDYGGGRRLGTSDVVIPCALRNDVPVPSQIPEVVWRRGIDLEPVDVNDPEAVAWLESCVFADHVDRRERLRAAIELARVDPPVVERGDLIDEIARVVAEAPKDATIAVFHSAVLNYLPPERRDRFAELMRELPVVWLSNEGPSVVSGVRAALDRQLPREICFLLGRDGTEALAFTHQHGRWIEWLASNGVG